MKNFKYFLLAALAVFCFLIYLKIHLGGRGAENKTAAGLNAPSLMPAAGSAKSAATANVYGFLIFRGDSSNASMRANLKYVNGVIAESLHLADAAIVPDNAGKQAPAFDYIRANSKKAKIIALVNNYSGGIWQITKTAALLADPAQRAKAERQINDYAISRKLDGINIDFEGLRGDDQKNLIIFCGELRDALHKNNLILSIDVESDPAVDYAGIANNVDQLILMDYDEHSVNTDPGPIASLLWFKQNFQDVLNKVPADKIILGLGAYAYDWQENGPASGLTYAAAAQIAASHHAEIKLDPQSQNDYFMYSEAGKNHTVWLLDSISARSEEDAGQQYGINNFAVYRFGSEDQALWQKLTK